MTGASRTAETTETTKREPHRVALYFAPPEGSALGQVAAAWLGRDAWRGTSLAPPFPDTVAAPARYGFHATLKAPFRLAEGRDLRGLIAAVDAFAGRTAPVAIPALTLARLGPFLALTEEMRADDLARLAQDIVTGFEPWRAPLNAADLARRRASGLSPAEDANLARYGYPYVGDAFRFHMTLTGPLAEDVQARMEAELRTRFAPFLGRPLAIDALSVFIEPAPARAFRAMHRAAFTGAGAGARS